jgi:transcription antitermination factor NusG
MICAKAETGWFVVQVRPNHEFKISSVLRNKGYEVFLPLYWTSRQWSDRTKERQVPLFPGYIFCQHDPLINLPIILTPGVIRMLSTGTQPAMLSQSEIESIQTVVESGASVGAYPYLSIGQTVRVTDGPLAGVQGIILFHKGRRRLVLSVHLIQRSVTVEIDKSNVTADAA